MFWSLSSVSPGTITYLIFLLLKSKKMFNKTLNLLKKVKFASKLADPIAESFDTIQLTLNKKILVISTALSVCFWLLIGISSYFVLRAVGIDNLEIIKVVSIYSSSIIVGAASLIPGGVGVAEGSIAGLLNLSGINLSVALALGILIRIFTLWYGVVAGFVALKISGGLSD